MCVCYKGRGVPMGTGSLVELPRGKRHMCGEGVLTSLSVQTNLAAHGGLSYLSPKP